jgi:hypothetical protein
MSSYIHTDELLEKHGLILEQHSCRGTHLFMCGTGSDAPPELVIAYMDDLERRPDLPDRDWILEALYKELAIEGLRLLEESEQSPEERERRERHKELMSKICRLGPREFDKYVAAGGSWPPGLLDDDIRRMTFVLEQVELEGGFDHA